MAISMDTILKLSRGKKVVILVLISVLIIGIYWRSFHTPQMRRIEVKESKLNDLIRERNIKSNIAKDLEKFKEDLRRLNEDLKVALAKLPDKKEIPNLLKSVSTLGKEAGLEVLLFKPQAEQAGQFYAKVPVELKFVGPYHRIGVFFYNVGTISRIVNIENFNIERAQAKEEKGDGIMLNTSCIATTYRYLEKKVEEPKKQQQKRR